MWAGKVMGYWIHECSRLAFVTQANFSPSLKYALLAILYHPIWNSQEPQIWKH